jgi:hypothetical protein
MRKLIVCNIMSLDGYYEGPGKDVMALFDYRWTYPEDESFDQYNAERLRGYLLLGRTLVGVQKYWPYKGNATPISRDLDNRIDKVVIKTAP